MAKLRLVRFTLCASKRTADSQALGKSYTMGTDLHGEAATSDSQRTGIIPRAVKQIFSEIQRHTKAESGRYKVEAKNSYIEVYNEDLIDLLAGDLDVSVASMPHPIAIAES